MHTEIDMIILTKQAEIDAMDTKHEGTLDKQEDAIKNKMTEIKKSHSGFEEFIGHL